MVQKSVEDMLKSVSNIVVEYSYSHEKKIDKIMSIIADFLGINDFHILKVRESNQCEILYSSYIPEKKIVSFDSFEECSKAWEVDSVLLYSNSSEDLSCKNKEKKTSFNSYIGRNILVEGKKFGVLCFYSNTISTKNLSKTDIAVFEIVSDWVSSIIGEEERLRLTNKTILSMKEREISTKVENKNLQHLFQIVPAALFVMGDDAVIENLTNDCCLLLGVNHKDAVGKRLSELLCVSKEVEDNVLKDSSGKHNILYKKKPENYRNITLTSKVLSEDKKSRAIFFVEDTTDQKTMVEQNKLFLRIINASTDLVSVATADQRLQFNNKAFNDFTSVSDNPDKPVHIKEMHPEWAYQKVCNVGIPTAKQKGSWRGSSALFNAKGEEVPMDQLILAFRDDKTKISYVSTVMRDMTKEKTVRKQLEDSKKNLERSNRDLEEFVHIISHDLKAPLRHISTKIDILEESLAGSDRPEVLSNINSIRRNSLKVIELIAGIFDMSKAYKSQVQPEEFDVKNSLDNILDMFDPEIQSKNAEVEIGYLPKIQADSLLVAQVFQNLIGNGLKYSSSKRRPKISIECSELDQYWHFSIIDNGIGVGSHNKADIFKPFHRLLLQKDIDGTGMGLTICRKIVELHDGKIWVDENDQGEGSKFQFTISKNLKKNNKFEMLSK